MTAIDKARLWAASLIALAAVYFAFYGLAESAAAIRYGVFAGGIAIAFLLAMISNPGRDFTRFTRDAGFEIRKVVWPTKNETIRLTGVVCALTAAAALFLWGIDLFFGWLLDSLAL